MICPVFLTDDASRNLEALYDHLDFRDVEGKPDFVLDEIQKALASLSKKPKRGVYPKELLAIGLREYREVFLKPCRIICRVMDKKVCVMVIADGRRDIQALLQRRLLQD